MYTVLIKIEIHQDGTLIDAKLSSASDVNHVDEVIFHNGREKMCCLLKCCGIDILPSEYDFDRFRDCLVDLAFYDASTASQTVDLFHAMNCIEKDLLLIYDLELQASSGDKARVCRFGHGIPELFVDKLSPSICYFAYDDASENITKTFRASITLVSGQTTAFLTKSAKQYCVTAENGMLHIPLNERQFYSVTELQILGGAVQMFSLNQTCPTFAPIVYQLKFDVPLITTAAFAASLFGQSVGNTAALKEKSYEQSLVPAFDLERSVYGWKK